MRAPKLPYTEIRNGRRFWRPSADLRALGFEYASLGPEGPEAWANAAALWKAAQEARRRQPAMEGKYPAGSLGAFYTAFQTTIAWKKKAPRTHEDYERAWKHIDPVMGKKAITKITADDCENFIAKLDRTVSGSERYRVVKCLRALFSEAIVRLDLKRANPALVTKNTQPLGRNQFWKADEIDKLVAAAEKLGHSGMAVGIRISWDVMLSPVDCWTLTVDKVKHDATGAYIETARTKTKREAFGALTPATAAAIAAEIERHGLGPGGRVMRRRSGNAYTSKSFFAQDFRDVRAAAFPTREGEAAESRQFLDIRRSANLEADFAGADADTRAELMANTLNKSNHLDLTYTPPTVAKAREVHAKREGARAEILAKF